MLSIIFLVVAVLVIVTAAQKKRDFVSYVNPYIGTGPYGSTGALGNTLTQIGLPFAHSPLTPQTQANENKCKAPYYYYDDKWQGIRKTHFISGSCVPDYGSVSIIPAMSNSNLYDALNFHSLNQDHSNEVISPSFYEVDLPESGVLLKATNFNRAGVINMNLKKYKGNTFFVLIASFDTRHNESIIKIQSNSTIFISNPVYRYYQGQNQRAGFSGHHYISFEQEALSYGIIDGDGSTVHPYQEIGDSSITKSTVAAYFEFERSKYENIVLT